MNAVRNEETQRYLTYIVLLTIVEATLFFIGDRLPVLEGLTLYLFLGLAAFRGGRALSFNGVFVWLRDWLGVRATPDSSGAGDSNNPTGKGPLYVLGELLCCPICSGTWVAAMLLVLLALVPHMGNGMTLLLGVAGIAEVLHWASEAFEWAGRNSREQSGSQWLMKNGYTIGRGDSDNGYKVQRRLDEKDRLYQELKTKGVMD